MTPRDLLNDVLLRFPVMYLSSTVQDSILKQVLSVYHTIVGATARIIIADSLPVAIPAGFDDVVTCVDSAGRWHEIVVTTTEIAVVTTTRSVAPFTLTYFISLRSLDLETGILPTSSITLLSEYLYTLLAIPNTQRAREAMAVTGIQLELPDDNVLNDRKNQLELEMEETEAMIPMVTVY